MSMVWTAEAGPDTTHRNRDVRGGQGGRPPSGPPRATPRRVRRSGRLLGLSTSQIVVAELAVVVLLAAAGADALWFMIAVPVVGVLAAVAFGRFRRRWVYEWIALSLRHRSQRGTLAPGASPGALLTLLRPAATAHPVELATADVGVLTDGYGLSAVLELGDPGGLVADAGQRTPSPATLLPPPGADQPEVRVQLLVGATAAPAPRAGSGPSAMSYRQLTEGRVPALQRAYLVVHVRQAGGFADDDLRRTLVSAVRRALRRVDRDGLSCRALDAEAAVRVLAELAHHDPAHPVRESWTMVEAGGLRQVTFQLRRWPDLRGEAGRALLSRLLALPGAATTVSLAAEYAGPDDIRGELVVRLAAPSTQALSAAARELRRTVSACGAATRRLDGTQLDGFAATLPLGGATDPGAAGLIGILDRAASEAVVGDAGLPAGTDLFGVLGAEVGGDGLMLGVNRRGEPTTLRLFRREPTRVALFGGLSCAQLIAARALALDAQVIVMTARPHAWEGFARGLGAPADALALVPAGRTFDPPPPSPTRPQLVVIDIGPLSTMGPPVAEAAWRALLLVRDELTPSDVDVLARADLALLQPLTPAEATIAGSALGLGDSAEWLTRIRADMVGVVLHRRTVRWALLSTTPIEQQLIGTVSR